MYTGDRVFCLEGEEAKDLNAIVIGTLLVDHLYALFYSIQVLLTHL